MASTFRKVTEGDLKIAGVVIGLTLAVLHILGLGITGVSVNPARSFGPAVFVGGQALAQLWMFLIVPSIAGIFAGICSRCCCCCGGACKLEAKKPVAVENVAAEKPASQHRRMPSRRNNGPRKNTNRNQK